jgi:glycosyltransferase involved in cell wall biosynthesis
MQTVIIDPMSSVPYSLSTYLHSPMGGTEATVVRVAEAMDAVVLQSSRENNEGRYRTSASAVNPDHLIVLRDPQATLELKERFPHARRTLWVHDLAGLDAGYGQNLLKYAPQLALDKVTLVCVSDYHANQLRAALQTLPAGQRPKVVRIYNPVDVSGVADEDIEMDPNKLVFFSSPHKGLDHAVAMFSLLHAKNKALRLYLANPGYRPGFSGQQSGIVNLGALQHQDILRHVKSSLCIFYPNFIYPETFGLVLGESNQLGTPVLTHDIGAASEVLNGEGQLLPVREAQRFSYRLCRRFPALRPLGHSASRLLGWADAYGERIRRWQNGERPVVSGRPEFSMDAVLADWKALAGEAVEAADTAEQPGLLRQA